MSKWAATIALRAKMKAAVPPPCQLQTSGRADDKSEWGKDSTCPAAHIDRGDDHDNGLAEWYFVTTWGDPEMRSLREWAHLGAKEYTGLEPRHLVWEEFQESIKATRGGKFREDLVMWIPNYGGGAVPVGQRIRWRMGMVALVIHHTRSKQTYCRARTPCVVVCTEAEYPILVEQGWEAVERMYKEASSQKKAVEADKVAETEQEPLLEEELSVEEEPSVEEPLVEMNMDEAPYLPDEEGMLPDVDMAGVPGQVPFEGTTDEIIEGGGGPVVVDKDEGWAWRINIALRLEEGCSQTGLAVDVQVSREGCTNQ